MVKRLSSKQRDVMVQCLLLANHAGKTWEWKGALMKCEPGQFVTSLDSLRKVCASDVSIQNIRTALLILEKWQFLTNESTKTGRLITILNWHTYQSDQPSDQQSEQQRPNKELTSNKNNKNIKNKNSLPENVLTFSQRFYEHLKKAYPEKKIDLSNGKVSKGANTVYQLIVIDGFDLDKDIRPALMWALKDDFWQAQVNSLAELRKKKSGAENHKFYNLYQRFKAESKDQRKVNLEW